MAHLSDVEASLATLISATVYPNGTGSASAIGNNVRVYRGWPNSSALNPDLAAGIVNITIFPEAGGHNTTRFPRDWKCPVLATQTLTVANAVGSTVNTVTFGGAGGVGIIAGIRTNIGAVAMALGSSDTPQTVAAALGSQIPYATVSGAVVSVPPNRFAQGRVGVQATEISEQRRQVQTFRISFWCPSAPVRDAVGNLVDDALGSTPWISLADGTFGRLIYRWSFVNDMPTKDALWRRDLRYDVEYATTQTGTFAQMLFGGGTVKLVSDQVLQPVGDIQPPTQALISEDGQHVIIDAAGNLIGVVAQYPPPSGPSNPSQAASFDFSNPSNSGFIPTL